MNDKIFEILRRSEFRVFFLFWRWFLSSLARPCDSNSDVVIKDKEILIKRKCHQTRCDSRCVSCRRHSSIWLKHHGVESRSLSHASSSGHFREKEALIAVMFHVFRSHHNSTTCFDLCIALCGRGRSRTPKTIIVIHSRSHYEMRRGSWRNLDLENVFILHISFCCSFFFFREK